MAGNVSSIRAGRYLGYESGGHGGRDDVMPAVMPTAHEEQFLGVNGMRLTDRRREPDPAAITDEHGVLTPDVKQDCKVILTRRPERQFTAVSVGCSARLAQRINPLETIPIECNAEPVPKRGSGMGSSRRMVGLAEGAILKGVEQTMVCNG